MGTLWSRTNQYFNMSDKRKVLVAKRKNDPRPKSIAIAQNCQHTLPPEASNNFKQGTKRSGAKTFANDRLKRLRTTLQEEVKKEVRGNNSSYRAQKQASKSLQECRSNKKRVSQTSQLLYPEKMLKTDLQSFISFNNKKNIDLCSNENKQGDMGEAMEWSNINEVSMSRDANTCDNKFKSGDSINKYIIVVDTNILISNLKLIQNIINMNNTGKLEPVIYIPWMVIEELDFIKDSPTRTNLKCKAQEAVKYIETLLAARHKNVMGQSIMEANGQSNIGNNQDNKIIACCLQVQENFESMILLTNDVNLRNKAYLNKIPVCSHAEIMSKIKESTSSKMETIIEKITIMCIHVITECLKNAYGKGFYKMPIGQAPPTSLQECFSIFQKYWFPVFEELLMKQFRKSVEDFSIFLAQNKGNFDSDFSQVNTLLKHCLRLCFFLRDVSFCKDFVQKTIDELRILADGECISFKSEI